MVAGPIASLIAASVALAFAMSVVLVRTPALCNSMIAAVYSGGQAEVVGVDDQTAHTGKFINRGVTGRRRSFSAVSVSRRWYDE